MPALAHTRLSFLVPSENHHKLKSSTAKWLSFWVLGHAIVVMHPLLENIHIEPVEVLALRGLNGYRFNPLGGRGGRQILYIHFVFGGNPKSPNPGKWRPISLHNSASLLENGRGIIYRN
jgi:hypothetical protein